MGSNNRLPDIDVLIAGIKSGDRAALARAITLIESSRADHRELADQMLQRLIPDTGRGMRVGITGVPGVGKSTLIDQLGTNLTDTGHKVSVLTVDPSSARTGGSILGDKTRMARLATDERAFVRPSPAAGTLGGVARKTRETMLACEAAGYDVILVETVGIGQSETSVAEMVDFFAVLMLPGAGDELQGIKKGVIEIADMIAVNKADGDNAERAGRAAAEYLAALHILTPASPNWSPPVITVSGKANLKLDEMWRRIEEHRDIMTKSGELAAKRARQQVRWMHDLLRERMMAELTANTSVREALPGIEADVAAGRLTPPLGVERIFTLLGK